jgi:hypothetical protein
MEILGLVWAASMLNPPGSLTDNTSTGTIGSPALAEVSVWFVPLAEAYGWSSSSLPATAQFNQYGDTASWLIPDTSTPIFQDLTANRFPTQHLDTAFDNALSVIERLPDTQTDWQDDVIGAVRLVRADFMLLSTDIQESLAANHCVAETIPYQTEPIAINTAIRWQVWVHNQYVGTVSGTEAAEQIAAKLRAQLDIATSSPDGLRPLFGQNFAAVSLNDDVVFVVDETMHLHPELPAAAVAVQWVNNLRIAVEAEPLGLAEVQMAMEGLQETTQAFYGTASWYGPGFHGRQTANGERFNQNALTAAHKTLPFGTQLKVHNRLNGKTVVVRINDRGPYIGQRSLDLSKAAAQCLGSEHTGVIPYEATILEPIPNQKVEGLITAIRQQNVN